MASSLGLSILITAQNQASGAINGVRKSLGGLASSARTTVNQGLEPIRNLLVTGLKTAAVGATAALGGLFALSGKAIGLAAGFEQTEVAFGTMLGSAEKAKDLMKQLFEFSASTPFQFEEISSAARSLLAFGVSAGDVQNTLRRLGDVAAGVNMPIGELSELYGKAKVQGRLFAEDINQLTGRGIPIIQQLAKVFGVTDGEVKKLIEDGKVGFPELEKAFQLMTDSGGQFSGMMEAQSHTLAGLWSTLKDNIDLTLASIGKTLVENLNLKDVLAAASDWIGTFGGKIQELAAKWIPVFVENAKALINYIQVLAEDGDYLNDWLSHMSPALANVVQRVAEFYQAAKSALTPITDFISRFVSWKDVAIAAAGIVAAIVVPALYGLVAGFAPVLAVVAGAIAIVATLRNAWESNFLGIRDLVNTVTTYLNERFGLLFAVIRDFSGGSLKEIWNWLTGTQTNFEKLNVLLLTARVTFVALFNDLVRTIQTNLPAWLATLGQWGQAAWEWIVKASTLALGKLGEWATALIGWVGSNWQSWASKLATWGLALWQWIAEAVPPMLVKLGGWLGTILTWMGQQLPVFLATLLKWATGLYTWIGDAIPKAIEWLTNLVTGMTSWGNSKGNEGIVGMVMGWASSLLSWIGTELIPKVGPELAKFGLAFLGALAKIALSLAEAALKIGVSIILAIAQGLLNLAGIDANLGSLKERLFTTIDGWKNALYNMGGNLITALKDGFGSVKELAANGMAAVIDYVKSSGTGALGGLGQSLYSTGQTVVGKMGEGFKIAKDAVNQQLDTVMNDIQQHGVGFAAGALIGRMYEMGRDTLLKMGEGISSSSPNLIGDMQRAMDGVANAFSGTTNFLKSTVFGEMQNVMGRMVEGIRGSNVGGAMSSALGGVSTTFNGVVTDLKNNGFSGMQAAMGRIRDGISQTNIGSAISSALTGLTSIFNGHMDTIKPHFFSSAQELAGYLSDGLKDGNWGDVMIDQLHRIVDAFNNVMDGFKAHVWGVMQDVGGRISNGLASGIQQTIQAVFDALNWITQVAPQWVKDRLGIHSPSKVFAEIGQNVMGGLAEGIAAMTAAPQLALATATDGLIGAGGNTTTINNNRTNNFSLAFPTTGGNRQEDKLVSTFNTLSALYG